MSRSYTARDFIQLPAFDANETVTVVRQIDAAGKHATHLPASVSDALETTVHAVDALDAEIARDKRVEGDPQAQRSADHAVDSAWSAIEQWLRAWMMLPAGSSPHIAHASAVYDRLFPDGMKFLNLAFRAEWAESERRVKTMHAEKLDTQITEMGGRAFVENVRHAHKGYGDALGTSAPLAAEPDSSTVRTKRDAVHDALRTFVAEVAAASARKKGGLAHETANALLAPITTWEPTHRAASAGAAAGGGDGGAGAAGGTTASGAVTSKP